jgi:hypothetical protein
VNAPIALAQPAALYASAVMGAKEVLLLLTLSEQRDEDRSAALFCG